MSERLAGRLARFDPQATDHEKATRAVELESAYTLSGSACA